MKPRELDRNIILLFYVLLFNIDNVLCYRKHTRVKEIDDGTVKHVDEHDFQHSDEDLGTPFNHDTGFPFDSMQPPDLHLPPHFDSDEHDETHNLENIFKESDETVDVQSDNWRPIKGGRFHLGRHHSRTDVKGKKGFPFSSGLCETRLTAPMNSKLECTTYSGCQATCRYGHQFPGGDTHLFFYCHEGKWRVRGATVDKIPQCYPTCVPACQNGGMCVEPNVCDCSGNYFGAYCQYEKKTCVGFPYLPNNANRSCNSETCTIICLEGHKFPDGSAIANVFCKDGEWTPGRRDWKSIPDCKALCDPPCRNGGNCLTHNVCQCPQQFRGDQCQYSVDVCDVRKLSFNGNYKCAGIGDNFQCELSCPSGMSFSEPPAPFYSCDYSTGSFSPKNVPRCIFSDLISETNIISKERNREFKGKHIPEEHTKYGTFHFGNFGGEGVENEDLLKNIFALEKKKPVPGTCFVWSGSHYKTFDGRIISFKSDCLYTLVDDKVDNLFHIQMSNKNPDCKKHNCSPVIHIYIGDTEHKLLVNEDGQSIIKTSERTYDVPTQLAGFRVDVSNNDHSIITSLTSVNINLRWNLKDFVEINIGEELWNRTAGLCGTMDGYPINDLSEYHDSIQEYSDKWRVETVGEMCIDAINDDYSCNGNGKKEAAHEFCSKLLFDHRFEACRQVTTARGFYEACQWDFCSCNETDPMICACKSLEIFIRDCISKGVTEIIEWRDEEICPMTCSGGRIYMSCGPSLEPACGTPESVMDSSSSLSFESNKLVTDINSRQPSCREGCFCPSGTFANGTHCVLRKDCSCTLRGKSFKPGDSVKVDCNTCTCVEGKWTCTDIKCLARCESIGDPHYTTFDGRHFNFMGKCSYYLVKSDNFSIEAENIACDGAVSEAMGFSYADLKGYPSCTKAVAIKLLDNDGKQLVVQLKQGKLIYINNEEQDVLHKTISINDLHIRHASSIFLQVKLPNGIVVWWDGQTRVYIDAPPLIEGKTQGLCGTFTYMQKDDFLTPEGDIESDVVSFANKWRTHESCDNVKQDSTHPCDINIQNKALAETYCSNITGRLFRDCHFFVDPVQYYQDCLYDMCSCKGKTEDCLCPIIAAYAKQCSHQGVIIEWRSKIRKCGMHCPSGQTYKVCGDSCVRTCQDISLNQYKPCTTDCVEGCNCPEGRTLNSYGSCIPISQCVCLRNGMEYPPGHTDIQPGTKSLQLCTCKNAIWECRAATKKEIGKFPNESFERDLACSATRHQVFTHCMPAEPVTCKNMHNRQQSSSAICHSGCICKRGYVLDSITKECVLPKECPCHHGGKSYSNGEKIQESCNTCTCVSGKWECSDHNCPGVCSTWGDSHFKTFDNKIFDFQGACEYVLVKGLLSETFFITIELVPCGTSGVSCSKSVTLNVGRSSDTDAESITFMSGKPVQLSPNNSNKRIIVREAGLFIFAEVVELGIVLQWDKGTRVSVRADIKWKGRLEGLCGNYDDNEMNDFKTPSRGVPEVSAQLFGDSWKLHSYCPESLPIKDTCAVNPSRKTWSIEKCSVLKSPIFRPCHSEVQVDAYMERCIFDTCACDQGGDCECLCTAVAAYAQECNAHGVYIKWRSQELCPIQCDEKCSEYKPCVQTCPLETCDNILLHKSLTQLCKQDVCVEGCEAKTCPTGEVYSNTTEMQCVPLSMCNPVCLTEDGKDYFEGDLMEGDDCYSCYCSRHKKTCIGQPCTSSTFESTTEFLSTMEDSADRCVPGWTPWFNRNHPKGPSDGDFEDLPYLEEFANYTADINNDNVKRNTEYGRCGKKNMVDIRCRDVKTQKHFKEFHEDVICTLDYGLICNGKRGDDNKMCRDYEISLLCDCGLSTSQPTTVTKTSSTMEITSTSTTTTTEAPICDITNPLSAHPLDCSFYYQCEDTQNGLRKIERSCPNNLWFNPSTKKCDVQQNVLLINANCKNETETICTETWTDWINISNPNKDGGDFELLSVMLKEGIALCPGGVNKTIGIECQFSKIIAEPGAKVKKGVKSVKTKTKTKSILKWFNYSESPDIDVTCNPSIGLECVNSKQKSGICQDYRIKLKCSCENVFTSQSESPNYVSPSIPTIKHIGDCRSDQVFTDCKVNCNQLCLYYEHKLSKTGVCKNDQKCIPGCIPTNETNVEICTSGFMWRDIDTCLPISDCPCYSHEGRMVKPGDIVFESECEVCQCINNHYKCDKSLCVTTMNPETEVSSSQTPSSTISTTPSTAPTITSTPTISQRILTTTVTPPPSCFDESYEPILQELPETQFTATSSESGHEPHYARMVENEISFHGWKPLHDNEEQYLEIDLGKLEPLYGIIVEPTPSTDEYLSGFNIMYSSNGYIYSYILKNNSNLPEVFRSPVSRTQPLQEMFIKPIEARYVRINPVKWKKHIVLSFELIGCRPEHLPSTTETTLITTPSVTLQPVCIDQMGLDNDLLHEKQVSVSSSIDEPFKAQSASLSSLNGWSPLTSSPHEWIQFNWLGERTVTGIITKGGFTAKPFRKEAWVETYKVAYSNDGKEWSYLTDSDFNHQIFMGNFDAVTPHKNIFNLPVHSQFIRVYPVKWENDIVMRVEILGCFVPYPELPNNTITSTTVRQEETTVRQEETTIRQEETTVKTACIVCPGILPSESCDCTAESNLWWDGEQCSLRARCPCIVGHLTYAVGTVYDTEDCYKCTCTLGGLPDCIKKTCPSCEEGFQSTMNSLCDCSCQPCPQGTVLCKTSNKCINSTQWCDGFIDCLDDEINCTTTSVTIPTTPPTTTVPSTITPKTETTCPPITCNEGFIVEMITPVTPETPILEEIPEDNTPWSPFGMKSSKWGSVVKYNRRFENRKTKTSKKGVKTSSKTYNRYNNPKSPFYKKPEPVIPENKEVNCPLYRCTKKNISEPCATPKCSEGYELVMLETKDLNGCQEHNCVLKKIPDGDCNVNGRTFNTFDNTEFKYDICNHTLAQDYSKNNWRIKLLKSCTYIGGCKKYLSIKNFDDIIELHTNMTVYYNGYSYTVPQIEKIGSQNRRFAIKQISNNFIIFISMLDFKVLWDLNGNVKITVPGKSRGMVNGLCGLFDGKPETDRQKPDGSIALSSVDFGDSWGVSETCETKVCPVHIQNTAWEMCSAVKKSPLSECEGIVNIDRFLSQCVESLCTCLESNSANNSVDVTEKCRCDALLSFVTECRTIKPNINLATWRVVNNCPSECPSPLIHEECYNRMCELSCLDLLDEDACPSSPDSCFPGCYCPDGYIREKDNCIKPTECRDCVCDSFGKTRYITFDKNDYTFNSNCTYILFEAVAEFSELGFKVLATTGLCDNSDETCVKSVTVMYDNRYVQIGNYKETNEWFVKVDGEDYVDNYPIKMAWFEADLSTDRRQISVKLLDANFELLFHGRDKGFSLQLPSHIYKDKTQGLCGSCNGNQTDDFKMKNGTLSENIEIFGKSWLAQNLTGVNDKEDVCVHVPEKECKNAPVEDDICFNILDDSLFGKCHPVVDPSSFVDDCHDTLCKGEKNICFIVESYARECQISGVCVPWRTRFHKICPYMCPTGLEYEACSSGCPETCDNYKKMRESPNSCPSPVREGCVCPEGKVLLNGTCVLESHCQPCDSEGHYPGEQWNPDQCSTCSCDSATSVQCERIKCPVSNTVCQLGFKSIIKKGTESDCCPSFICVPDLDKCNEYEPEPVCPSGLILKTETDKRGCLHFVCACKPKEECEDTTAEFIAAREPGYIVRLDTTGCCPVPVKTCNKSLCPSPPTCPMFHHLVEKETKCCPDYACEPPKDKCLYEFHYTNSKSGGARQLPDNEKYTEAKNKGDKWKDGPCRLCECQENEIKELTSFCLSEKCPDMPVSEEFTYEKVHVIGECCPTFKKIRCKVGNKEYKVGEVWVSPDGDKCKNITCKVDEETADVYTQEIIASCNKDCPLGYKYEEPHKDSKDCCGDCKPFGCVINGEIKMPNTTWFEDGDNCTTHSCSITDGVPIYGKGIPSCQPVTDCPADQIILDGCCEKCNFTASSIHNCYPESLKANETLKLIRVRSDEHGICENKKSISDFTECRGVCDSYTFYNQHTGSHDKKCDCCQASETKILHIPLECEDGSTITKTVKVPSSCNCLPCEEKKEMFNLFNSET
ncbi:hemolectin [Lycorma delicatula]|uniref:hemolectin n=1 Tax=Lycorma delicatula TaxID=130591 RepID=UPI003F50D78C